MKINTKNTSKIEEAVRKAEGRATERLLNPDLVWLTAMDAEVKLDNLGIPKKYRVGCEVYHTPPPLPNSYKWRGEGTRPADFTDSLADGSWSWSGAKIA